MVGNVVEKAAQEGHASKPSELAPPHTGTHEGKAVAEQLVTVYGSTTTLPVPRPVFLNASPLMLWTPDAIVTVVISGQF